MKRKIMIIVSILGVLLIGGYFALSSFFSGPIYSPGDLTTQDRYAHLLKNPDQPDRPNYFELNDDISLYYSTEGTGKPVLIIHGGPGMPYNTPWAGLSALDSNYQFYYYHQRGCGKSTRPFDTFESSNFYQNMMALNDHLGLPAQIADIEQIRRKLGQEKITLIGHSFGGFLASLYAVEFPDRVESLLLVTPANVLKIPSDQGGLYDVIRKKLPEEKLEDYDQYLEQVFDFKGMFKKSEQQLVEQNKAFIQYYNLATNTRTAGGNPDLGGWIQNACFMSMGKKHDYSNTLTSIQVPTLVIHGEKDIIPVESVQLYLDNIPNSRLEVIPDATHFPFDEQPDRFAEIVSEFLGL